ncbi:hypothetical protein [Leisingera sp. S232]|uniref:hypothetical protein n=1 Tax=Leisingera sp. S232 TaxID=3415132 RepID=UPI003C79A513
MDESAAERGSSSSKRVAQQRRFELRKIVLRLVFTEPVHYSRDNGFLNTKFSMPFNVLGGQNMMKLQNGAAGEN